VLCGLIFECGHHSRWNHADGYHRQFYLFTGSSGQNLRGKLDQDVAVKGTVLLKTGTKAFGKITSSRANPRKSEALALELTSIAVSGRNVPIKTNSVQPGSPTVTARQARYGHTAGTLVISPGTKMQFQLARAASF
jgi:hypothetical protein